MLVIDGAVVAGMTTTAIALGIPSLRHSYFRKGGGLEKFVFRANYCHFLPFRIPASLARPDSGGQRKASSWIWQGIQGLC